ncbi:receptor expression-enhancing protein 2 isoform X2 [Phodopus roborovskii]|uniref:receptor expression-enhancing protein 2 isoform X2 n=1 Tax=Phodopus roborovskii TaxID=109678 RepID=UPI0021E46891|nr:receptor expression-enhancing protein 2 isoform X2 [Phodopus roborovskii]
MSKDGTERVPARRLASSLKLKEGNKRFRGRLGSEGEGACPTTAGAGGARRHRGLPFKSRHRPRPAAAAGTSPLTAATPRSADPTAAAAANCSSCSPHLRPRAAASSPGLGPRPAMVSWIISRLVVLIFGTLYPAYSSYKAVKTKNVKEYVKWMMYWIVFAFFTTAETLTDIILSWFPFYFELKIAFVIWLLSPYTKGSSVLYRKFVHPTLSNKEKEIDEYITQARDKSYETMMRVGKRGLNLAANAAVTAAAKGVLSEKLRSFSMQDLTLIRDEDALPLQGSDGRLRPGPGGLLDTIEDLDDPGLSVRSSTSQADPRTETSEDDLADKAPKRTKSIKRVPKVEPVASKTLKTRPKKKSSGGGDSA